jgi:hypothetical protein
MNNELMTTWEKRGPLNFEEAFNHLTIATKTLASQRAANTASSIAQLQFPPFASSSTSTSFSSLPRDSYKGGVKGSSRCHARHPDHFCKAMSRGLMMSSDSKKLRSHVSFTKSRGEQRQCNDSLPASCAFHRHMI